MFGGIDPDNVASETEIIPGSTTIALGLDTPFDQYYFTETVPKLHQSLIEHCSSHHLTDRITVDKADANTQVSIYLNGIDWGKTRGVIFIDPKGMQAKWSTLTEIANTRALDVWYLFPLGGANRQIANNMIAVDEHKERSWDDLLGTTEWRNAFYTEQGDMISGGSSKMKTVTIDGIVKFAKSRFETIFGAVADPLILRSNRNAPLFALFFAVSNKSPAAIEPAMNIANYILNMKQ